MLSLCDLLLYSLALPSMFLFLYGVGRVSYSIWWKPKSLERGIKRQGIRGTPYKPMIGDMKELVRAITKAWSKPIYLTHQIVPRVDPFTLDIVQKYGMFISIYHLEFQSINLSPQDRVRKCSYASCSNYKFVAPREWWPNGVVGKGGSPKGYEILGSNPHPQG